MSNPRQMLIEIIYDDDKGTPVLKANQAAVDQYGEHIEKLQGEMTRLNQTQKTTGTSVRGTNMALMDAGRIVQDLPYGIRGVANNIDPMIQSFQRLSKETGGARNALRSMLGSLTGPMGIALGVSAVTSILVAFGPQISSFFKRFLDGSKDVKLAKEELDTLFDVSKSLASDLGITQVDALEGVKQIIDLIESQQTIRDAIASTVGTSGLVAPEDQARRSEYQKALKEVNTAITEQSEFVKQLDADQRAAILERIANLQKEQELRENMKQLIIETNQEALFALSDDQLQALDLQRIIDERNATTNQARATVPLPVRPDFMVLDEDLDALAASMAETVDGFDFGAAFGAADLDALREPLLRYGYTLSQIKDMGIENAQAMLSQAQAAEMLSNVLTQQVVGAIGQTAEMFGELLSGDMDPGELFSGFQMMFADFLSVFGEQLIALGIGKIGLDKLFSSVGGGPAAIAAGIGLKVAAGLVKSNAQSRLNGITGGGSVQNTTVGYRASLPPASAGQAMGFPDGMKIKITDGKGDFVMSGMLENERRGKKMYVGG